MHANNLKPIQNLKMNTWHPYVSFELALNSLHCWVYSQKTPYPATETLAIYICHRFTLYI